MAASNGAFGQPVLFRTLMIFLGLKHLSRQRYIGHLCFSKNFQTSVFQIEGLWPVPNVWSVYSTKCALCFTNGKGNQKQLATALGEYELSQPTADFWLVETIANGPFVHYPVRPK